jgi:hypothetical protein
MKLMHVISICRWSLCSTSLLLALIAGVIFNPYPELWQYPGSISALAAVSCGLFMWAICASIAATFRLIDYDNLRLFLDRKNVKSTDMDIPLKWQRYKFIRTEGLFKTWKLALSTIQDPPGDWRENKRRDWLKNKFNYPVYSFLTKRWWKYTFHSTKL